MRILVTGGPVHAKLDAVKFVTNRFKGGLMAKLADELGKQNAQVTYLCAKGSREPELSFAGGENGTYPVVVHHDGFHDYRAKVMELAPEFDAIVLGAAVANLIPVCYYEHYAAVNDRFEGRVEMPLEGKFPSHNYKPNDQIMMKWAIAPRIIDEVRVHMKPGANLFGFKLLSGVEHAELVTAAYEVLLGSKATNVFANDAQNLNVCYGIGKDRSSREMVREGLAEEIIKLTSDEYYSTEVCGELPEGWDNFDDRLWKYACRERFVASPEGFVFGTVAFRHGGSFVTTRRGKNETEGAVLVMGVDHDERIVRTRGGKATLNAPLLSRIFNENPKVDHICHYHDEVDGLPAYWWAPPGTVRDSGRPVHTSFNISGHGCFLLYDKKGNQL